MMGDTPFLAGQSRRLEAQLGAQIQANLLDGNEQPPVQQTAS